MSVEGLTRKESIQLTAIQVLDEFGIAGMTTKEIARREGVSEPAIYKHFEGKKDIFNSVIKAYSKFDQQLMETVKSSKFGAREGIVYFIDALCTYYENYPELMAINFSMDAFKFSEESKLLLEEVLNARLEFIEACLQRGMDTGQISGDILPDRVSRELYGTAISLLWLWKLGGAEGCVKEEVIDAVKKQLRNIDPNFFKTNEVS